MAMKQYANMSRTVVGDGSSTTVVVDFFNDIAASMVLGYPSGVNSFSGGNVTGASLSGSKVTFTFSTAPGSGSPVGVSAALEFPDNS